MASTDDKYTLGFRVTGADLNEFYDLDPRPDRNMTSIFQLLTFTGEGGSLKDLGIYDKSHPMVKLVESLLVAAPPEGSPGAHRCIVDFTIDAATHDILDAKIVAIISVLLPVTLPRHIKEKLAVVARFKERYA